MDTRGRWDVKESVRGVVGCREIKKVRGQWWAGVGDDFQTWWCSTGPRK